MRPPPPLRFLLRRQQPSRTITTSPHPSASRTRISVPTTNTGPLPLRLIPITRSPPPPPTTPPCCKNPAPDPTLPIDRTTPLLNTAPFYNTHILLPTGTHNWPTKIDASPSSLPARLKRLSPGGILITNTSFSSSSSSSTPGAGAWVYPQGLYIPDDLASKSDEELTEWLKTLHHHPPTSLELAGECALVLICSHGNRDARCGAAAPGLEAEFRAVLRRRGWGGGGEKVGVEGRVRVAGCSHLSGHKWAGNVVVYRRGDGPGGEMGEGDRWGCWYGRVGVEHVEGIVKETIEGGRLLGGGMLRGLVGAEVGDEVD